MNLEKRVTAALRKLHKIGGYGSNLELIFNINGEFGELYLTARGGHFQHARRLWSQSNAYDDMESFAKYKRSIVASAADFSTEIEEFIEDFGGHDLLVRISKKPILVYCLN